MVPQINVTIKSSEDILALLQDIHTYYAIGMPHLNNEYAGYQHMKKIVEEKINQIISGNLPPNCTALLSAVNEVFNGYQVFNHMHHQFPSINLSIGLLENEQDDIKRVYLLNLKLSLLTNHFLVYYEDVYTFNQYKTSRQLPLKTHILSSADESIDPLQNNYRQLVKLVNDYYPLYKQVNHRNVFTRCIKGGLPYNSDAGKAEYPIYNYLFGNDVITDEYKISL